MKFINLMKERYRMDQKAVCSEIWSVLKSNLPKYWDGKDSVLFMKNNECHNWRQMEWPGWYFQFQCERFLSQMSGFDIPGPAYGNVEFDGFYIIPWDFKTHSNNTGTEVPTNGYQEVMKAIQDYGKVGFIIACGDAIFDDENASFKTWHNTIKGATSIYEQDRIRRGATSRRRKAGFSLKSLDFIFVDRNTINYCGSFQSGMRNSNGNVRNAKVMLNLNDQRLEHISFPV